MNKYYVPILAFVSLVLISPAFGQEWDPTQEADPESSAVITQHSPEPEDSRAVRSFSDSIAWNKHNHFGFFVEAVEGRISNVFPNSPENRSSMLTAYSAGIFSNHQWGKSGLHLDYGAGYRIYSRQRNMDSADHYGNVTYTYQANRNLKFQLSDLVTSTLNDPYSSFNPSLRTTINWTPSPSYEVALIPQRLTQNQASGQMDVGLTRRTHFSIVGSFNSNRYGTQGYRDTDTVQVGAGLEHKFTSWFYLSSSYSASVYSNNVDKALPDSQIHRAEIGRFHFMLSRRVEVFASGGVNIANDRGKYRFSEMFSGGISRSSEMNVIYANYQRTMISALGLARILRSDLVTLGFGQRLTNRTNFRLSSSFMHGSDFDYSGLLNGCITRIQYEYAISPHVFASANYAYQYQKTTIAAFADIPHFSRYTVFVGLQFAWPSIHLTKE
jgi:hypothetical protein